MPIGSDLVIGSVGSLCKLYLNLFTKLHVRNFQNLLDSINRTPGTPLITVSNHTSTLDDPLIWGILPLRILFNSSRMRWGLGAEEILFTNSLYNSFFGAGKVLSIRRGHGIFQDSINRAIDHLNMGDWVHVFPEGRVIPDSSKLSGRLKWGVGRLILESKVGPILLPIIHQGMEEIKPLEKIPRLFKPLLITVGDPIDTGQIREELINNETMGLDEKRARVTNFIADEMKKHYNHMR